MKLENIEILHNILEEITQKEMSFKLAYKFSKMLEKIEKDYQFYIEKFRDLINHYAEKDEQNNPIVENNNIKIKKEFMLEAEEALLELRNIDIEDIDISFSLEELEDLRIKPSILQFLLPFIKE